MSDCAIEHRAVSLKRRWIIPVIIGVIAIGLWSGLHQPEPVTCDPGSHPVIGQVASPTFIEPAMCRPDKIIWSTPGYNPGRTAPR
jgi:hypothetical protein